MSLEIFAMCILVPTGLVLGVLTYLRPVLRGVLLELGVTEQAAEFWLRSATALSVIGSVMLVLFSDSNASELGDFLRSVVLRALFAIFVAVSLIVHLVWRSCRATYDARADESARKALAQDGEAACAS